ncbi:Efflux transporter, RND family, MFP subunit, AcrA/E family [hydrothermal vent metagenome]|uniref:Efflux transporter, RND family, MFP subunit, AcrA/E family n=1 Tax=hydrothermal vent metagenome TaxID=652676 RepID=A0A3B0Y4T4_9ZZZZ
MKIKNTLTLFLVISPAYFSHVVNAADTGYYQNFSTHQSENNQQYRPVQQTQRMPQQVQNNNYQNSYQNNAPVYYNPQSQQQNQATQIVQVSNIKTGAHVVLGGTVVANKEIVLTAQISGRVDYVAGSEGDWFNAGQVLVALNHDNILAQRDQAIANLYSTEASLGNAKVSYTKEYWAPQAYRDFNNQQAKLNTNSMMSSMGYFPSMFEKFFSMGGMPGGMPGGMQGGGMPGINNSASNFSYPNTNLNPWINRDLDLYNQENHVNIAKSQIMAMRSRVNEIDTHLRDARSISPFEGVIVKKLVETGDTVQRGQALIKYSDTRSLQLKVEVPARLVSALHTGEIVPAKLDVGNTYIEVRVAQIYPTADSQRHTVTVKFDLPDNVPGGPGMYAEVMVQDINTPINSMPVIPSSAIVRRGSLPAVFVLNAKNKAELRLVRLGDQVDNQHVAVLAGVQPGENVFAYPHPGMRSGWTNEKSK